jgi:CBS domain-containing protein
MRTMRVRDVMTRRVAAVTPNTPFRDVAELMLHHEIGAIPVIDDTDDLIGLITEADLVTKQAYGDRRHHLLGGLPGVAEHEADIPVMCRLASFVPGVVDVVHHLTVVSAGTTAVEPAEAPVAGPGPPAES